MHLKIIESARPPRYPWSNMPRGQPRRPVLQGRPSLTKLGINPESSGQPRMYQIGQ